MATRVVEARAADLRKRRSELLARSAVPYEELRRRAELEDLHGDEWRIWENVEVIDFLLEADDSSRSA